MLTLSLTILPQNRRLDIQVNENQTIMETLTVLDDKGLLLGVTVDNHLLIRSERSRERLNPLLTYEQAGIFTGDILYVGEEQAKEQSEAAADAAADSVVAERRENEH